MRAARACAAGLSCYASLTAAPIACLSRPPSLASRLDSAAAAPPPALLAQACLHWLAVGLHAALLDLPALLGSFCCPPICSVWGTVREQGKLRGQKGLELPPLGGANITGRLGGAWLCRAMAPPACPTPVLGAVFAVMGPPRCVSAAHQDLRLLALAPQPPPTPHPPHPHPTPPTHTRPWPAVVGNNMSVLTRDGLGDYYRPLAPGRYTVQVTKEGYEPFTVNLTVPSDGSGAQRHFLLAREGSGGSGQVAYSLKSLGSGSGEGGAGGALPWHSGAAAAGSSEVNPSRGRDRLLMLAVGAVVVYGLWLTHSRLQRRTHQRRA